MNGEENRPSAEATLAVILGVSKCPRSPHLSDLPGSESSAEGFYGYLTGDFGLPEENVKYLFDSPKSPPDQLREIGEWLFSKKETLKDLIVFYTGHGGFTPGDRKFFLATRSTTELLEGATSIRIVDFATVLKIRAPWARKYLIFDCCFAGSVVAEFMSSPGLVAVDKTKEVFPSKGTAVLCSSSSQDVSISPLGGQYTRFSEALFRVLRDGNARVSTDLSLHDVGAQVRERILEKYPEDRMRPEVHSPDQTEGNVASVHLFPNAALRSLVTSRRGSATADDLSEAEGNVKERLETEKSPDPDSILSVEGARGSPKFDLQLTGVDPRPGSDDQKDSGNGLPVGNSTVASVRSQKENFEERIGEDLEPADKGKKKFILLFVLGLIIVEVGMLVVVGRGEYLRPLGPFIATALVTGFNGLLAWRGIAKEKAKFKTRVRTRTGTPSSPTPSQAPSDSKLPLTPSFESAVYGGLVGGALAGLAIALLYCLAVAPNANRVSIVPRIFAFGCLVGYCYAAAIQFAGSRFLQLGTKKHYPFFNEATGGVVGGAIVGVPIGALGSLFFVWEPTALLPIPWLVVGCLLGALCIILSVLIYDYKGSVRAVIRALLLSIAVTTFPAAAAAGGLLLWRVDRLLSEDAIRDIVPAFAGGAIICSTIGFLMGLLVGLTLLIYRVWKTDSGSTA